MQIGIYFTTPTQDTILKKKIDFFWIDDDSLEKIVNFIFENRNTPMFKVIENIKEIGFDFIDESDVDTVMIWLDRHTDIPLEQISKIDFDNPNNITSMEATCR